MERRAGLILQTFGGYHIALIQVETITVSIQLVSIHVGEIVFVPFDTVNDVIDSADFFLKSSLSLV